MDNAWAASIAQRKQYIGEHYLSVILRTRQIFGMEHLITVLRGEKTEMSDKHGHADLPTFGVGKDTSKVEWRSIFRQINAAGFAHVDVANYSRWSVTEEGWRVLRGEVEVRLRKPSKPSRGGGASAPVDPTGADEDVLAALKKLRRRLADERDVPAYVIFPDRTLIEMAKALPTSRDALSRLHGIGAKKLDSFGDMFLAEIRDCAETVV